MSVLLCILLMMQSSAMQAPLGWDRHWNRYWLLSGPRASAPRNRSPMVCVELRPDPGKVSTQIPYTNKLLLTAILLRWLP